MNNLKSQFNPRIIFLWGVDTRLSDGINQEFPDMTISTWRIISFVPVSQAELMSRDNPEASCAETEFMGFPEKIIQPVKLIFATNNRHKLEEIRFAIGSEVEIISLYGCRHSTGDSGTLRYSERKCTDKGCKPFTN